jgi:chromosome segregation protein
VHREAEAARAAAKAAAAMDVERLARAERDADDLAARRRATATAAATAGAEGAAALAAEAEARAGLDDLLASDAADRDRHAAAERTAGDARDRLRSAEDRSRTAEGADLQARLELDLVREQVLVELAGLGDLGLSALASVDAVGVPVMAEGPAASTERPDEATADAVEAARFEAALEVAARHWMASPPTAEPPSNARLASLRRRYHELGAANPFAAVEYQEVRERLEHLDVQDRDLREAIVATRNLINELNTLIADQFRATFKALEGAFDQRFRQLFGGGFARLSLTDPEDLSATGVEIVARPPGKKPQALAMLSGGERALTAVALLFAMLEVRPVPFCVLDEVDAALDEANVGRFTDALRSLAGGTQFVVITHNRGTIEAADALYGVTVGEDSVSRVISLRLDEATALAAQGRPTDEPEFAAAG